MTPKWTTQDRKFLHALKVGLAETATETLERIGAQAPGDHSEWWRKPQMCDKWRSKGFEEGYQKGYRDGEAKWLVYLADWRFCLRAAWLARPELLGRLVFTAAVIAASYIVGYLISLL